MRCITSYLSHFIDEPDVNRKASARKSASARSNTLRIIAGQWRGRKLQFPDVPGLRPTADRVRETLFNWLQGLVEAEDCLDLYAGSGACGLEALSRGARSAVFVDTSPAAVQSIQTHLQVLGASNARVVTAAAGHWLQSADAAQARFGLVFLDPPFADGALNDIVNQLENSGVLKPRALIYLESGQDLATVPLPATWRLRRNGRAGAVYYGLYDRVPGEAATNESQP